MSQCRHTEIFICGLELNRISDAQECLPSIHTREQLASESLSSLAGMLPQVFESTNMEDLQNLMQKLTESFEETRVEAQTRLRKMSDEVHDKRVRYRNEDERFHDRDDD